MKHTRTCETERNPLTNISFQLAGSRAPAAQASPGSTSRLLASQQHDSSGNVLHGTSSSQGSRHQIYANDSGAMLCCAGSRQGRLIHDGGAPRVEEGGYGLLGGQWNRGSCSPMRETARLRRGESRPTEYWLLRSNPSL